MPPGLATGTTFGPYRIEGLIGRGGMGEVYLAEHVRLQRKVALKLLAPSLATDEGFRDRFLRESQHAARLEHPNIVAVYDAGEEDGRAYISMHYVEGIDLARLLKSSGPLPPAEAVGIVGQIAGALDAAHADGLVHRDVKPANILLEGPIEPGRTPRALLSDFGITKRVGADGSTTGQFVGTVDYMAPEQITGRPTDGRTDEYSLACVLFQCLTGKVPFERDEQVGVMYAHVQASPPKAADIRAGLPPEVDAVLRRGMAKSRDRRYPSCSEFAREAAAALGVQAPDHISWPPRGSHLRPPRPRSRHRRAALVAAAATLAVALAGTGLFVWPGGRNAPSTVGTGPPATSTVTGPPRTSPSPLPFPASIAWARVPNRGGIFGGAADQGINRVIAGPHAVVAVGSDANAGEDDAAVWVSGHGLRWHRAVIAVGAGPGTQGMSSVEWFDGQYVAVGGMRDANGAVDAAVWTSENGNTWKADPKTMPASETGDQVMRRLIRAGPELAGVGIDSQAGTQDAAVWLFDGTSWSQQVYPVFVRPGSQEVWGATAFRDDLIVVGSDDARGDLDAALWRFHANDWKRLPVDSFGGPGDQVAKASAATGPGLVVVGSDSSSGREAAVAWTSADGVSWTERTLERPGQTEPQEATNVIAFRGGAIAVGAIGQGATRDAAVWTSPDGIHWTRSTEAELGGPLAQHIKGLTVAGDRLVAVGSESGPHGSDAAVWVGTPSD